MNIILISQGTGKGATTARRILDRFASRYGTDTWMTSITLEGLKSLRSDLVQNASKTMSVGCYKAVGLGGRQLLWVIGSRKDYAIDGQVAIATRKRAKESHLEYRAIKLLARAAGFAHDLGKINAFFQEKIRHPDGAYLPDPARHEYLSIRLLDSIINGDRVVLDKETGFDALKYFKEFSLKLDNNTSLDVVKWIVLTHHATPSGPEDNTIATKNIKPDNHVRLNNQLKPYNPLAQFNPDKAKKLKKTFNEDACFTHYKDAHFSAKFIAKIQAIIQELNQYDIDWRGAAIIARAAMMMADHCVSARKPKLGVPDPVLMANSGARQELTEHLLTVGATAYTFVNRFIHPDLDGCSPDTLDNIGLPSDINSRFHWQNIGADFLSSSKGTATLLFNMAATGTGKTRANMRFLYAMQDEDTPFRVTSVFNLRSLTVQTGKAYRQELGINENDMATVVGDMLTVKLNKDDFLKESMQNMESLHSYLEDDDSLLSDDKDINSQNSLLGEYELDGPVFQKPYWLPDTEKDGARLLAPPILVSTIDYLSAAADFSAMGKNALAMLRVASSDLILDEIDGYDPLALIAVCRLIVLCGLFNRNVVVSSATISEPVANAVQKAFSFGVELRNGMLKTATKERFVFISDTIEPINSSADSFMDSYIAYANAIVSDVQQKPAKRIAKITSIPAMQNNSDAVIRAYGDIINTESKELHSNNHIVLQHSNYGELRVSIGLVRVANVDKCVKLSRCLALKKGMVVTSYHASDWKLRRVMKEMALNSILKRSNEDPSNAKFLSHPEIKRAITESQLEQNPVKDIRFIVVATPVEEVGADHDFDWGIIEPSSAQSIVQTAGRVNRHRLLNIKSPNIAILNKNMKGITSEKNAACFIYPGYELQYSEDYKDHSMNTLLDGYDLAKLHSGLRISDSKTPFAVADDNRITYELENGYGIIFKSIYLWNNDYLKKYNLRNKKGPTSSTQLIIDEAGTLKYYNNKLAPEDRMEYGAQYFETSGADARRTFLCYSRETVAAFAESIDEDIDSALSFTVHTFGSDEKPDTIVFDSEFGAYRKSSNS